MAKAKKGNSFVRSINVDGVDYPLRITVFLIKGRRNFKGVVRLDYFGMFLNDIRILEDFQGNTIIVFPTREHTDKETNETREFNVFIPSQKLKGSLNNVILGCYLEALEKDGPIKDLLKKDGIAKEKAPAKRTRKAKADEKVEAIESSELAEPEAAEEDTAKSESVA